jgi:hypothetical protein
MNTKARFVVCAHLRLQRPTPHPTPIADALHVDVTAHRQGGAL